MKENAKCLDNIKYQQSEAGSVCVYHSMNQTKNSGCESYIFIALEINK